MEVRFCNKCLQQKRPVDFYASSPTKCKECYKADVRANRASRREQYSAFEAKRARRPERKAAQQAGMRRHRAKSPEKYKARNAVSNAIRDGKLKRMPCEICGSLRVQAHHADYSKPLEVTWLCFKCHREEEHGQVVVSDFRAKDGGKAAA